MISHFDSIQYIQKKPYITDISTEHYSDASAIQLCPVLRIKNLRTIGVRDRKTVPITEVSVIRE